MIDAKEAVVIAKERAADLLGETSSSLEEIERESYKDREVWSITLSLPRRDLEALPSLAKFSASPPRYKPFLIYVETGELVAMKLREVA